MIDRKEWQSLPEAFFDDRFKTYRIQRHLGDHDYLLAGFRAGMPLGNFRWTDLHVKGEGEHDPLEVGMIVNCSGCPLTSIG